MKTVILAGGEGTRLRPLTYAIPKPLIPIGEKPILELLIRHLRRQGFRDIILSTGYRAELIETYFRDGGPFGVRIDYVREKTPLGTAGVLGLLRGRWPAQESCVVMNGDIVTTLNVRRMAAFHRARQADLTVGVKRIRYRLPYGVVHGSDGRVLARIAEKPRISFEVCAGIYVMRGSLLQLVPRGKPIDMPALIARAIAGGKRVLRYSIREYWMGVEQLHQIRDVRNRIQGRVV
jgi:NDP-sugar pyrophosphorylase family protein